MSTFDFPAFKMAVLAALAARGIPGEPCRIVAQHNADIWAFAYPGYDPVRFTPLEFTSPTQARALIEARLTDMLNLPVI